MVQVCVAHGLREQHSSKLDSKQLWREAVLASLLPLASSLGGFLPSFGPTPMPMLGKMIFRGLQKNGRGRGGGWEWWAMRTWITFTDFEIRS